MTVLLVMDAIAQGKIALDTPVMVSATALAGIPSDASHVSPRLKAGEVMNVLELLECVMLSSDCHACNVLAELVAGSVDNFIAMMNARAAALDVQRRISSVPVVILIRIIIPMHTVCS